MKYLLSLIEKAATTYLEALLTVLLATTTWDVSFVQASAIAAIPAFLTVIANGLPQVSAGLPFWPDLTFRALRTFATSAIGFLVAGPVFRLDVKLLEAAVTAGVVAALAVVKGLLARNLGKPTPSLLPARLDPA
jgi:hypothetical protein